MENKINKFKNGNMNATELINFKKEIDMMSDEELDNSLNNCEPGFTFTTSDINAIQEKLNKEIRIEKRQIILRRVFKTCAAILFPALILCSVALFNNYQDLKRYESLVANKIIIETDNGESSMTILPDGSKINMGPKSSLAYSIETFNSETRQISYSGEGRFSITKNPDAPFTLKLSDFEIKVLGTVFSLYAREDKNNAEIHLEEGSLQLISLISDSKELLNPGETAIINTETGTIKIIDDSIERRRTAGQSTIYFTSATLGSVAKELELYYGKETVVSDDIADIHFTGSLPTDNIEQVLYILENTLNISISINDTDNVITFMPKNN